jgi:hypothetical protein
MVDLKRFGVNYTTTFSYSHDILTRWNLGEKVELFAI